MNYLVLIGALIFCSMIFSSLTTAKDVVKINTGQSIRDIRSHYSFALLYEALNQTVEQFGEYEVQVIGLSLPNFRKMQQIADGNTINTAIPSIREWHLLLLNGNKRLSPSASP